MRQYIKHFIRAKNTHSVWLILFLHPSFRWGLRFEIVYRVAYLFWGPANYVKNTYIFILVYIDNTSFLRWGLGFEIVFLEAFSLIQSLR